MSTVDDTRKDILDSGTVTTSGGGTANSPWISTDGVYSVLILVKPSIAIAGVDVYSVDSNDQSTDIRVMQVGGVDATEGNLYQLVTPGAAFLSLSFQAANGTTFTYSIRSVR